MKNYKIWHSFNKVFTEMIKVHTQKEIAKIIGVGKDTVMKWKKEWNL